MDTKLRQQILDFLTPLPCFSTEEARRATLYAAGLDRVLHQTDLSKSPNQAVATIVYTLEHHGTINGEPALAVLLRQVATTVGDDKQEQIQDWCVQLLHAPSSPTPKEPRSRLSDSPGPSGDLQNIAPPPESDNIPEKLWDVFVCYAKEDLDRALTLYRDLCEARITPWMAYEDILPGQDWEYEITQALTHSRYVLALLSSNSVSRKGFIQRELAHALDVLSGLPLSSIFLIPVRLDECEPLDHRLQRLHWVDLFPDYGEGLGRILRVLKPTGVVESVKHNSANMMQPSAIPKPKADKKPQFARQPKLAPTQGQSAQSTPLKALRRKPLIVSADESRAAFGLDTGQLPCEYIQNQYEDQGEVVIDHATGLMWQKGGSDYSMSFSAAQDYIDDLNVQGFAGYDNWRLPTIPELMSLLEPEEQSNELYINPIFESFNKDNHCWSWSADLRQKNGIFSQGSAWIINFNCGEVSGNVLDGFTGNYVRAVRSVVLHK